jgi:hypothetical protein
MLKFKVTGVIFLVWLLINLTYGSNDPMPMHCGTGEMGSKGIKKGSKPTERRLFVCIAPSPFLFTNLTVLKYNKTSGGEYKQRFFYEMSNKSMSQWDEKSASWKSLSEFKDGNPDETYMVHIQNENEYTANINMSNMAPEGISTITQ